MSYKIVTPMTLWQDYNPTQEPLEVVVTAVKNREKVISKEIESTGETVSDGKIRAYATVVLQKSGKAPALLFLPGSRDTSLEILRYYRRKRL